MMNFMMMTLSMTVAVVVGGFVSVALYMSLITNSKFLKWFTKRYVRVIETVSEELEDVI